FFRSSHDMSQLLLINRCFITFAGAKVLLFYDIRKRKEEKIFARPPPAARRTKHPLKTKERFLTSSQMMYLLKKTI
ncbi:MAG: hypothetical protein IKM83_05235, partial [Paludibacteraceae bacterium]|nr:hypothetical protein [Paludibacteraceae bacterium]